jgi:hypothetical protein
MNTLTSNDSADTFTSFAAVMVGLKSVVDLLNANRIQSARIVDNAVTDFGGNHAFARRQAALSMRNILANRKAAEVKPCAGELALLTCAVELVNVGMSFH